jgi:hypothetical protein
MVEDMQLRGLSEKTQGAYVRAVRQLAEHYGKSPAQISEEELRQYFLYLKNDKQVSPSTFTVAGKEVARGAQCGRSALHLGAHTPPPLPGVPQHDLHLWPAIG